MRSNSVAWGDIAWYNAAWLGIGFLGQLFFSARFIVQWLVSEHRRKSVIPEAFWYFSLLGGSILLAYAIHKRDPVFMLGQGIGLLVYWRNIVFIRRERCKKISQK